MFDVAKTLDFYVGFLGFAVDWEHRFDETAPLYMQVSRGGCSLHLSEHHGDCTPGSAVYIEIEGLKAYHAEISGKGYRYMNPGLGPTPWGSLCMDVIDPSSNRLSFNERIESEPRSV